jgi:hypothetical protein
MDATQLLKEKERERDRDKEKERKSKLNNSAQIFNSNNTNNNAHIKQRNNIHSNSSNESSSSSVPNEHVLRLEADIKRLKADLQVSSLLNNLFIYYIFNMIVLCIFAGFTAVRSRIAVAAGPTHIQRTIS